MINLEEVFERHSDEEFIKFERVDNPLHDSPDMAAFLLLSKLVPNPGRDMVSSANRDQIWLSTDTERLAEVATEEDIITLIRCGVMFDSDADCLSLFV